MSRLLMLATTATMEEEMLEEQGESRRVVRLEQEVLIHIQVRRIKQEDEKARGLLQRLQLLEMRPTATAVIAAGFRRAAVSHLLRFRHLNQHRNTYQIANFTFDIARHGSCRALRLEFEGGIFLSLDQCGVNM